ncbi:hypothetical protein AB3S75_026622 [Citrus x aurantiifolia]
MKLSLKLPDDSQNTQNPPILKDSPLIFSAHFSFFYTNPTNFTPTFLLYFKPQFGNFSLHKAASSSNPNPTNSGPHFNSRPHLQFGSPSNTEFANRSISDELSGWQDLKLEPRSGNENGSFFNGVDSIRNDGIEVMINLRWGVNLPANSEVKMPYLTVNKIGMERVEKVEEVKREKNIESDVGDYLELLKGMLC